MKNFALLGAAGYIAPRHMKAIKETGNLLVAAMDPHDAVGVMDSYFPDAAFFVEFERFDRHVEKLKRMGDDRRIDYVSIASPNYLHDAHMRFALRIGADAVCEKPLVLNPWNVDALRELEAETGRRVNAILQLRLHSAVVALKREFGGRPAADRKVDIDLTYITPRGRWYLYSWKGDGPKSGGLATNIGIHFFDLLQWIFGPVREIKVHLSEPTKVAGFLEFKGARVRWLLSIDGSDLPQLSENELPKSLRYMVVDDKRIDFSEGMFDLHSASYKEILAGRGFGLDDVRPSIAIVHAIRHATPVGLKGDYHPLAKAAT
jgi:UDP-N-acetyl-2-amino-2-deoxyglucuronate dehydrogenase